MGPNGSESLGLMMHTYGKPHYAQGSPPLINGETLTQTGERKAYRNLPYAPFVRRADALVHSVNRISLYCPSATSLSIRLAVLALFLLCCGDLATHFRLLAVLLCPLVIVAILAVGLQEYAGKDDEHAGPLDSVKVVAVEHHRQQDGEKLPGGRHERQIESPEGRQTQEDEDLPERRAGCAQQDGPHCRGVVDAESDGRHALEDKHEEGRPDEGKQVGEGHVLELRHVVLLHQVVLPRPRQPVAQERHKAQRHAHEGRDGVLLGALLEEVEADERRRHEEDAEVVIPRVGLAEEQKAAHHHRHHLGTLDQHLSRVVDMLQRVVARQHRPHIRQRDQREVRDGLLVDLAPDLCQVEPLLDEQPAGAHDEGAEGDAGDEEDAVLELVSRVSVPDGVDLLLEDAEDAV
mmetsp:Transcript_19312/g.46647  ORF Transcript_19312/g.46647 Transcript_19312/m.46647 type:complete len:405 (-) Transcript_19312:186-1400(-)